MTHLDVSSNMLSGDVPPLPPYLIFFNASLNRFQGSLPPLLPSSLEVMEATQAQLRGGIPGSLSVAGLLTRLVLASNSLTGTLPGGWRGPGV